MSHATQNKTFTPISAFLSGPFGYHNLGIACEVKVIHEHEDDSCRGGELKLLKNRHVDRRWKLPAEVFVERETEGEDFKLSGPYTSLAVQPPQKGDAVPAGELYMEKSEESLFAQEWDFLLEHADTALKEAGVGSNAPDSDKVHAFAEYAVKFKKSPTYDSFHPVDVVLHSSYCTGAANVFFALANISGIVCRSISIRNHSMVEVLLDGEWHFVDNHVDGMCRFVKGFDYVDVTLKADTFEGFTEKQKEYLSSPIAWERSPWNYSSTLQWHFAWGESKGRGGRTDINDGYGVTVPCDPYHAHALYPYRSEYLFPLWDGTPELTLTEKCSWVRIDFRLPDKESLIKQVYIEKCTDNPVVGCTAQWWFYSRPEPGSIIMHIEGHGCAELVCVEEKTGVYRCLFEIPESVYEKGGEIDLVLENCSGKELTAVAYPTPITNPAPISTYVPEISQNCLKLEPIN